MKQITPATFGFERYRKVTRREAFFPETHRAMASVGVRALAEPLNPKGATGAQPLPTDVRRIPQFANSGHGVCKLRTSFYCVLMTR